MDIFGFFQIILPSLAVWLIILGVISAVVFIPPIPYPEWKWMIYTYMSKTKNGIPIFMGDCLSCVHAGGSLLWISYLLHQYYFNPFGYHQMNLEGSLLNVDNLFLFGIGYFIIHGLITIAFVNPLSIFILHHIVTSFGLYKGYYFSDLEVIMLWVYFMGEITNPVQLVWELSRKWRYLELHHKLSRLFTYYFIGVRCFLIPVVSVYICHMIFMMDSIPRYTRYMYLIEGIGLNIAGIWWGYRLYLGYRKKQREIESAKNLIKTD